MRLSLFFFILLLLTACSQKQLPPPFDVIQTSFADSLNQKMPVRSFYWRQAALFYQDSIYKNRDSIFAQLSEVGTIHKTIPLTTIQHDSLAYFQLGQYQALDSLNQPLLFTYVIAWKKEKQQWLKELEVLYPTVINQDHSIEQIRTARKNWETLSNSHQHRNLVQELYVKNGFYFNDGYIYRGREAISEKYQYMAKEKWHIRLSTIETIQVSDSLFYDVGQYVSSGKGHYLIVWQLQENGDWQVLLDFNF